MTLASPRTRRPHIALVSLLLLGACTDDAVVLPDDWNTLHRRKITVDIFTRVEGPAGLMRPLQGIDGAPLARDEALPDVTLAYWDRPGGSDEPDGTHVDVVRITAERCELALDGMYQGGEHQPERYDFAVLDEHLASVDEVRGDGALLALDLSAPGACPDAPADPFADALTQPSTWADAAASVVRHAIGDDLWEPGARARTIAGVQLFHVPEGATPAAAFELFAQAARRVRAVAPSVSIASPTLRGAQLEAFLDFVTRDAVPVDVICVGLSGDPAAAVAALTSLAADIAARSLDVELAVTHYEPDFDRFPATTALGLAQLGASEAALRIALQPLPVRWFINGAGPLTAADRATRYFGSDGSATSAFVMRAPMRQIEGEQRVTTTLDAGDDLAVSSTLDGGTLSVLIAQPASATGVGRVTYTLTIPGFTLPSYPSVEFRLSEIDQGNDGVQSFFFSDIGALTVDPATGDVHITRTLPVPGVHFIEIDQP